MSSNTALSKGNERKKRDEELVYQLEGRPSLGTALPLGLQHVLAMFTANLAPILIIAGACSLSGADTVTMVQCAMFASGLTTLVQLYPIKIGKKIQIGSGLPIVMGTSFSFVPTAVTIAGLGGLPAVLGSSLLGSLIEVIMGVFYKYIRRFFPPLVVGCTLVTIGVKLLGVGADYFAGGSGAKDYGSLQNLSLGFTVFVIIALLQHFGKGLVKNSALLIGLMIGYVIAIFMGIVDFTAVKEAGIFTLPLPARFGFSFPLQGVLSFMALYIVSGLETIGNTAGIAVAGFDREAEEKETSGAILADALGSAFANLFNALPNTAFGQNVGIVSMTKVVNKWCIAVGAIVLMACGFFPKLGAVFATIPSSVLGGAIITVFAMILLNGVKMIAKAGFSDRNLLVLGLTLSLGLGLAGNADAVAKLPKVLHFIFSDAVAATCIIAILTNVIFPIKDAEDLKKAKEAMTEL